MWQSADPILGKYLPVGGQDDFQLVGMGGVYNPVTLNPYGYGHQNPLRYKDPDGRVAGVDDAAVFIVAGTALLVAGTVYVISNDPKTKKAIAQGISQAGEAIQQAGQKVKNLIFSESKEGKKDEAGSKEAPKAGDDGGKGCPNPDGCKGKQDHRDKVGELSDKARAEAKEGEQVLENKQIRGVLSACPASVFVMKPVCFLQIHLLQPAQMSARAA